MTWGKWDLFPPITKKTAKLLNYSHSLGRTLNLPIFGHWIPNARLYPYSSFSQLGVEFKVCLVSLLLLKGSQYLLFSLFCPPEGLGTYPGNLACHFTKPISDVRCQSGQTVTMGMASMSCLLAGRGDLLPEAPELIGPLTLLRSRVLRSYCLQLLGQPHSPLHPGP